MALARHKPYTSPFAAVLRGLVRDCPDRRGAMAVFGGAADFFALTRSVAARGAVAVSPVSTRRYMPDGAQQAFLRDCVQGWNMAARPGLPQLARALLRDKGVDIADLTPSPDLTPQEAAIARAIMLTALRAEVNAAAPRNAYHNPVHTAHVAVMAGYLTDLNDQLVEGYGRFVEFTLRDKLLVVLAAFAHDVDHPGRPNPPGAPCHNERAALAAVMPLMRAAGMNARDIAQVETMILTTSPNGPHSVLKDIARAHAQRRSYNHRAGAFDDLAAMAADRPLVQMAAILSDADLFASAGTGMAGSRMMARRLTNECRRAGINVDFTTAASCDGFITHVVGRQGFASQAAMAGFNRAFMKFVAANDAALKAARAPS